MGAKSERQVGQLESPATAVVVDAWRAPPRKTIAWRETEPLPHADLAILVEALCMAERGETPAPGQLPYEIACWFLDHVSHFLPVAFAALRLTAHLARTADEGVRAKVAGALSPFVREHAAQVEEQLLLLSASPSRDVRTRVTETLVRLLRESAEPHLLTARFRARAGVAAQLIETANKLLAQRDEITGPSTKSTKVAKTRSEETLKVIPLSSLQSAPGSFEAEVSAMLTNEWRELLGDGE